MAQRIIPNHLYVLFSVSTFSSAFNILQLLVLETSFWILGAQQKGMVLIMNNPVIVIIDSGASEVATHYEKEDKYYIYDNNKLTSLEKGIDVCNHGTGIRNIIKWHCPNADIINISIMNSVDDGNPESLIRTLSLINEQIPCKLINISLAFNVIDNYKKFHELQNICDSLRSKGVLLIAAFDNWGSISYPAALPSVIGVVSSENCTKNSDMEYIEGTIINVCAKGNTQSVYTNKGTISIASGNSLACAHVTGILANCISPQMDLTDALMIIKKQAKKIHHTQQEYKYHQYPNTEEYDRVAVFPFNKELQQLIRFEDMLHFSITEVYDTKYSGLIGLTTNEVLQCNNEKNHSIIDVLKIDYNEFDTIVIGHVTALFTVKKIRDIVYHIIEKCVELGKNIYSLDRILDPTYKKGFTPQIKREKIYIAPMKKLYRISKPIIGVFGTNSKQGKFTIQLSLRKMFLDDGYTVGQIGTEPTAFLFGMDECFHFGYNSECEITRYDTIAYINKILHDIEVRDVDVIIIGCQSRTIPLDNGNLDNYTLSQVEFLFATQPDLVVLTINAWDDIDYIKNTIKFIESCSNAKIVAVVVFPVSLNENKEKLCFDIEPLADEDFQTIQETIKKEMGLYVTKLNDINGLKKVYSILIDYLVE